MASFAEYRAQAETLHAALTCACTCHVLIDGGIDIRVDGQLSVVGCAHCDNGRED